MTVEKFTGLTPLKQAVERLIENIEGVDQVEWYNAQYEDERLIAGQGVLIEFPNEAEFSYVTKQTSLADVRVRVHVYTQVVGDADGHVTDTHTLAHEAVALEIRNALHNRQLTNTDADPITHPLRFAAWKHWHRQRKWLITWVDFDTRVEAF